MIPDENEYIGNIANSIAKEVLLKLKKASECFSGDMAGAKIATLHHHILTILLSDFIGVMNEALNMPKEQLIKQLIDDVYEYMELPDE